MLVDIEPLLAKCKEIYNSRTPFAASLIIREMEKAKVVDVVEVKHISEQIIRKQLEVSDYWKNNVKNYRATQGYSDIEHDTDNFLRGYNEAVEDFIAILNGLAVVPIVVQKWMEVISDGKCEKM